MYSLARYHYEKNNMFWLFCQEAGNRASRQTIITNDITKRHNIMDFDLFYRVVKYIIENVGKNFSANAIENF